MPNIETFKCDILSNFQTLCQGRNSELLSVLLMMMYGLAPINLSFSKSKPTILMTQPNFEVLFGVRNIIINFGIGICDSFEVAFVAARRSWKVIDFL